MDDLISRQMVIDTLNIDAELLKRALDDIYVVSAERAEYEWGLGLIESCIFDVKELPSVKPRWIPVTERLPEEDGLYFVTTSKGQVQVHVFNHNGNSEEYWMRCNKAWLPLPEPYREEG